MRKSKEAQYIGYEDRFALGPTSTTVYILKSKDPKGFVQVKKESEPERTIELLSPNLVYLIS